MFSIRAKRNILTCSQTEACSKASPFSPRKEELFAGSFELIDLLYSYVSKDGVGLPDLQHMCESTKDCVELLGEFEQYYQTIKTALASLSDAAAKLEQLLIKETAVSPSLTDTAASSGILSHAEQECFTRMYSLIAHSESLLPEEASGISEDIQKLKEELTSLEASLHQSSQLISRTFQQYKEQMTLMTSTMNTVLCRIKSDLMLLTADESFLDHLSLAKESNIKELTLLEQRERDNMILLNDLISFLVQLRSILTSLQKKIQEEESDDSASDSHR